MKKKRKLINEELLVARTDKETSWNTTFRVSKLIDHKLIYERNWSHQPKTVRKFRYPIFYAINNAIYILKS